NPDPTLTEREVLYTQAQSNGLDALRDGRGTLQSSATAPRCRFPPTPTPTPPSDSYSPRPLPPQTPTTHAHSYSSELPPPPMKTRPGRPYVHRFPDKMTHRENLRRAAGVTRSSRAPTGGRGETPTGGRGETPTGGRGETPTGGRGETPTGGRGETPTVNNGVTQPSPTSSGTCTRGLLHLQRP
ncbi:protodermal factor 1-like, partial [Penaeus chinensis]|uniref:protodermal factor 1-like n=1 Tax=Penaeus chinensis TaxID=139456 RepID=UPI001FB774AA